MTNKKKPIRKQVQMSEMVAKWYEDKAEEIGSTQNSLMIMAIKNFMDQQEMIEASKRIPEWLALAERIKAKEDKKNG
ncbi:MAG: hypothetical protein GX765_05635 [Candidatus Moranbacteria bacterium]|nr:hypothetical protein [Candidatus Moranbacteria bacterium]